MKIIHYAYDKSPFMVDLLDSVAAKMDGDSQIVYVTNKSIHKSRPNWKLNNSKFLRFENLPTNTKEFLNFEQPDIVTIVGYRGKNFNNIKKWCKINNKKFFVWAGEKLMEYDIRQEHYKKYNRLLVWLKYRIFEQNTKKANGIIACGNRASYIYQENTGNKLPIVNIPYVFDLKNLLEQEMMSFDGKNLTFLISGRLMKFRDPLHTVRLFSKLIPLLPELNLKLVVSGLGPLFDDLKNEVKVLNIEDKVSYENEFKDWYDIHQIYFHAHILFCMHTYNGWSLTIQEGMAAGQLVVATNVIDGADQLIIDGYNGLLVHKSSDKSTLNEIVKMVRNRNEFEKCRKNARESVKSIDLERISLRLFDFLVQN